MDVRSQTYIMPVEYCCDKMSLGAYDAGVEAADKLFLSLPMSVDSQLARGLFQVLIEERKVAIKALAESDAYTVTGLRFSEGSTLEADAII
ncbi:Monooxygenase [Penicillium argentinense]|uniref:Monooxygenase n=1 Tax=Penicillium argentinense TaxID=1131581 RepID=A0A9W9KA10_9EURO|nr:Monooxygenase [Penicillium argentinense]KAJ5098086.1 Monooxygenase [Penicillium argentinense]